MLRGLVAVLLDTGCTARGWTHHMGLACSEVSLQALRGHLLRIAVHTPVVLVGHSRGAHFCEVLARREPELVAGVVSLGSPSVSRGPLSGITASIRVRILAASRLSGFGVPGLVTRDCLDGGCCRSFWRELGAAEPLGVPHVLVGAETDRVVRELNTAPHNTAPLMVRGGHLDLLRSRTMRRLLPCLVRRVGG